MEFHNPLKQKSTTAKFISTIFKQLPTMISDLNKLGIALKSLNAIDIGTVGLNAGNIQVYQSAIKGLSAEQAAFALATKGANAAQIEEIMTTETATLAKNTYTQADVQAALAKNGLVTASTILTAEQQKEIVNSGLLTSEKMAEVAAVLGLETAEGGALVAKKALNAEMVKQQLESIGVVGTTQAQILGFLGLTAAEGGAIVGTNLLNAAFVKLKRTIESNGWLLLIGAIITAVIASYEIAKKKAEDAEKAIKALHEEAEQALEDTKTSLSNDKSELQSVNSELETTKERLKEISSIGAPTLTEQNELNKLSLANTQLETQKTLLENNIKLKQKSAALDAKSLLGTQVEMQYSNILDGTSIESHNGSYTYRDHARYQASNLKNAYNIYMNALREGNISKQKLAQELIDTSSGNIAVFTSELLDIIESFKYDDGKIIEGYENLYNEYMSMIYNLQSLTNPDTFLEIAKSVTSNTGVDYEKAISDAYRLAYEGNFDIASLNQEFVKALSDAGIDESTIDYIFSLKEQEYQLVIDKINEKYKTAEIQDKATVRKDYVGTDENGKTITWSEYVEIYIDEEIKKRQEEINAINQSLNDYAKENPIEFQLITSYDEGFALLDKYIEEEKNKAENTADYVGDYIINSIKRIYDEAKVQSSTLNDKTPVLSISKTVDQLNTKLKPAFDSLKSAYQNIFTDDGFTLNEIDILSTCNAIQSKLDEIAEFNPNLDYSAYEDFVRILSDSESTVNEVQNAFNLLATSITEATLSGTEDFETMKAALEDLGVVNNELVAFDALISNTEALKAAGLDLANVINDNEIEAFVNEMISAENCGQAIAMLTFQKELYNLQGMDTADEIANLLLLAENAGYTGEVISYLTELEQIYQTVASGVLGTNNQEVAMAKARAAELQKLIAESVNKAEYKPQVSFDGMKKSAKSAGSSAGKAFTDALDKELTALDKKMEAGYIDFNDYIQARLGLIEDYYRQGKISADQYYSYLEKHYDKQLSYMDKVVNAVTRRIDKELDKLQKKKDDVENYYRVQIEALEREKSLLEETNKQRERELSLQQSLWALEKAKNQRTILQYSSEKGMHYVADDTAIRDAQQDVEDAEFEIKISEIEKSISKLEEARDRETDSIDEMIDKLKEYRDYWKDVTSAYEKTQEDLLAAQILGQDWEKQILDQRLDKLNDFKDNYISIQQAMADAAYQAAQAMANAQNVNIGDSSGDKNKTGSGTGSDNSGSDNSTKIDTTSSKQSTHSYAVVDDSSSKKISTNFSSETDAKLLAENLNTSKARSMGMTLPEFLKSGIPGYSVKKYHTGLQQGLVDKNSFDDDFKLVQKVGLGEKEVHAILQEGEAVATPEQISNIADGLRDPKIPDYLVPLPDDHPIMVASRQFEALLKGDRMPYFENTALKKMNDELARTINNISNSNMTQHVTIGDINITCPGVTSQEVAKQVGVEVNNLFNGLHLDALQESKKR